MPSFKITNTSAYRPEQMYAIAADIERYPEFIKLIHRRAGLDARASS